jgi:N-acetyl-anhydromuramyl-L-alanine amidase AmpD
MAKKTIETMADRPNDPKGLLWYPHAIDPKMKMPTQGSYSKRYPMGAVVHFTAGWDKKDDQALGSLDWGIKQGWGFLMIGPSGVVYQAGPLDKWSHHAGTSAWKGLGKSVSKYLVGIEVACAGEVTLQSDKSYKPYFNARYTKDEVRTVKEDYGCPAGTYKKFTDAQEDSLVDLLIWLKHNAPDIFSFDYVLGHHEVAGKEGIGYWRKTDPGGSLSMPMKKFREYLKAEYEKRHGKK